MSQSSFRTGSTSDVTPQEQRIPLADQPLKLDAGTVVNQDGGLESPSIQVGRVDSVVGRRLFPFLYEEVPPGTVLDPTLAAGLVLAHFRIEKQIGTGGMAAVFQAVDQSLGRTVALKVLFPHLARDEKAVRRFQNEARSGARFDHENIATVYHCGEDQGLFFIAYELIDGQNLRQLIDAQRRLSNHDTINVGLQMASAIRHMAARSVVHRDIKPSNIQVTPWGQIKLIDFGLARDSSFDASTDLTIAGTTLGTFDYISPEQAKDPTQVTTRSDIYSLGCSLFHMLTGRPPYPEGTVLQKLLDHQGKSAPDAREINSSVTPRLAAVLRKMMANDPEKRYATADDLSRDLTQAAAEVGMSRIPVDTAVWGMPRRRDSRFWRDNMGWIVTACILVLMVFLVDRYGNLVQSKVFPDADGITTQDEFEAQEINESRREPDIEPLDDSTGTSDGPQQPGPLVPPPVSDDFTETPGGFPFNMESVIKPGAFEIENPLRNLIPGVGGGQPAIGDGPTVTTQSTIVLKNPDGTTTAFETLEAACSDAVNNAVIELRFNGVRRQSPGSAVAEKAIRISQKSIRIVAAQGYSPRLIFNAVSVSEQESASRLVRVDNGKLTIEGVEIDVDLETNLPGADWAVFSTSGDSDLVLASVLCTVRNPNFRRVSLVRIDPTRVAPSDGPGEAESAGLRAGSVTIRDSFIRGQHDLVLSDSFMSTDVKLANCAFVIDGTLLTVLGQSSRTTEPGTIDLSMSNLTCLLGQGLIRFDSGESPVRTLPNVEVSSQRNVFSSLNAASPMILMRGSLSEAEFLQKLSSWSGVRNRYEEFRDLIFIASSLENVDRSVNFDDWTERYEPDASNGRILWRRQSEWKSTPVDRFTPTMLEFEATESETVPPPTDGNAGDRVGAEIDGTPTSSGIPEPAIPSEK